MAGTAHRPAGTHRISDACRGARRCPDGRWGERRTTQLRAILDRTPTISIDSDVIEAYAALVAQCRSAGHALHDKRHSADRWVAACAIAKGVELLAGDGIYAGAPGLSLLA